jgi:hypothetical protein
MSDHQSDHHELDELGDALRERRPPLTSDAYERVHDRVIARMPAPRRTRRTSIATALLLATGVLLSGGGASLAISGGASDTTAVRAQYVAPQPPASGVGNVNAQGNGNAAPVTTTPEQGAVAGEQNSSSPTLGEQNNNPESQGGVAGEHAAGEVAEAPQQVVAASGGGELPFTGFAAIPIVVIGVLLIGAGALLRRRTA